MSHLHVTSGRWKFGFALALATAALWGSLPIALKILLSDMQAQTVVWYRFTVAALLLGSGLAWRGKLWPARPPSRGVLCLLTIAALGFAANNVVFVMGLGYITPTAGQVVIQLAPMLLLFGGVVVFKERFGGAQIFGLVLLIGGMLLFFHERLGELLGNFTSYAFGVFLVVLAAIVWAIYALAQKQLLTSYHSPVLMWMIYASGAVLLLPFAEPSQLLALDRTQLAVLLDRSTPHHPRLWRFCRGPRPLGSHSRECGGRRHPADHLGPEPHRRCIAARICSSRRFSIWSLAGAGLVTVGCAFAGASFLAEDRLWATR
ncbi:MAG: DMT family transporter [Bryobacterales bacterium]|nr:DMT family transporter [Bryobacterales bacterium]